jgi:hypothetical protein
MSEFMLIRCLRMAPLYHFRKESSDSIMDIVLYNRYLKHFSMHLTF